MQQIYTQAEPGNWNKWLPYLLFANIEVPRETWGFLPLKLLYGRYVWGLLKNVRKSFEEVEAEYGHFQSSVTLHEVSLIFLLFLPYFKGVRICTILKWCSRLVMGYNPSEKVSLYICKNTYHPVKRLFRFLWKILFRLYIKGIGLYLYMRTRQRHVLHCIDAILWINVNEKNYGKSAI